MDKKIKQRIILYIVFSYGIAWLTSLVIYLRGGLVNSPELVPGSGITEALLLTATGIMFAPAISNVLTRLVTKEGWKELWIAPKIKTGWRYWLLVWLGTPILIAVGAILYFLFFPDNFDPSMQAFNDTMAESGLEITFTSTLAAIQIGMGILIAPLVNLIPIFGEEFGWRGYLLPKLLTLGEKKAYIYSGIIWGLWHAPIIAMGHNYGLDYPGAPWSGILMFVWATFIYGTFFGWVSLRAKSVWPAVIGHAVLNGTASAVVFFTAGSPNPLLGPLVAGVIGSAGFAIATALIFLRGIPKAEAETTESEV